MSLAAPLLPPGTLAGPLRCPAAEGGPRSWALPSAGAPRQGEEEGAELRPPCVDPVLPGPDLRYTLLPWEGPPYSSSRSGGEVVRVRVVVPSPARRGTRWARRRSASAARVIESCGGVFLIRACQKLVKQ